MSLLPNLSNAGNWEFLYTTSRARAETTTGAKIPIPVIQVPILIESHLIAIYTDSDSAKGNWVNAGWAAFYVPTGITVGGANDGKIGESIRIFLNERTIITVPKLSESYALELSVPPYFDDVTYSVYQYIGLGEPTIEGKLNAIYDQLLSGQP